MDSERAEGISERILYGDAVDGPLERMITAGLQRGTVLWPCLVYGIFVLKELAIVGFIVKDTLNAEIYANETVRARKLN